MMSTTLQWVLGGVMLLAVVVYAWYHRHPTFKDLQKGAFQVPEWEVNALAAVLADAEVEPDRVLVVTSGDPVPRFRPDQYWITDWVDHRLRVLHRFGGYYRHAVAVAEGRIVGISLGNTAFSEVPLLAELTALRHIRFPEAQITSLQGVSDACPWVEVHLSRNQIKDLSPLLSCSALANLDLAGNQIEAVPDLKGLPALERLDLRMNALTNLNGITGHPWLKELELYGNKFLAPMGIAHLPRLEWLGLTGNALTLLEGLEDLPALRNLQVSSNQLLALDAAILTALPALRRVEASNNNIQTLPEGYRWTSETQARPTDGQYPKLNLAHNPVALNRGFIPEPLD